MLIDKFKQEIESLKLSGDVYVGYSGGLDSTVLLYLISKNYNNVTAIHFNHGISNNSDDWQSKCECFAKEIGVKIVSVRLNVDTNKNIELQARDLRREKFVDLIPKGKSLFLAHHLNDQVETVLFRLFRGTGAHGASGIKKHSTLKHINIYRPLLDYKKEELIDFAKENNLSWVEDESNKDLNIDRNYIRNIIVPSITERWPKGDVSIARFADICRQQQERADSISSSNNKNLESKVPIARLNELETFEQLTLLRDVVSRKCGFTLDFAQANQIVSNVIMVSKDSDPIYKLKNLVVRKCQEYVHFFTKNDYEKEVCQASNEVINFDFDEEIIVGECKIIITSSSEEQGPLKLVYGKWGKTGKKVFQSYKVPTWMRNSYPLIYYKGKLMAILGLWERSNVGFTINMNKLNPL